MDALDRAAAAAALGLRPSTPEIEQELDDLAAHDPDPRVRAAALGGLVRLGAAGSVHAWMRALADPDAAVRRRACEVSPAVRPHSGEAVVAALADPDPGVAEAAASALGELGEVAVASGAVAELSRTAGRHADPLVREAAVAALGSLGHPDGRAAVLTACSDRPAVRRRAVVALAAFEGPEVEDALRRALSDRDWQVRQAAEDLYGPSA